MQGQTLDPSFQPTVAYKNLLLPGTVRALSRQADGRIIVAGDFILLNNWPTNNVARLWPDGRVDTTFLAPAFAGGLVQTVATDAQGRVIVGGNFSTVSGQQRRCVARLLADGSLDPSFQLAIQTVPTPVVRAIVVQPDGKIILGGSFAATGANGAVVPHLIRLLPTGQPDASFVPAMPYSGQVGALLLQPTGELLVAGNIFSNQLELVRRLLPTGSLDPTFTIVPANQVTAGIGLSMAATPTGFVLAGRFTGVGSVARTNVARFLANGALDASFTSPLPNTLNNMTQLEAVAVEAGGSLFIGGDLSLLGYAAHMRRLVPTGAIDNTYFGTTVADPDAVVNALLVQPDGKLLVGGQFTSVAGQSRSGLARLLAPVGLATNNAQKSDLLAVSPNPAHTQLQVQLDASARPQTVELLDALGRPVLTQQVTQPQLVLSINALPAGVYVLRATYAHTALTRRVVIE